MDRASLMPPFRILRAIAAFAAALLTAQTTAAQDPSLLPEILRMLRAELSEEIVMEWLEGAEQPPPRPTADEMIELQEAGASDRFLGHLLSLARRPLHPVTVQAPPSPPEVAAEAAASPPVEPAMPTVPVTPPPAADPPAVRKKPPARPPASLVDVYFELLYQPDHSEDEEPWDLLIYLDGRPLANVPSSGALIGPGVLELRHLLAPGRHVLWILQERHEELRGDRWSHLARVAGEPLRFDLRPGAEARIELRFRPA